MARRADDDRQWNRLMAAMSGGPPTQSDRPVVLFQTPWRRLDDGWCIAARSNARAMVMGGIDVRLLSWMDGEIDVIDPTVRQEVRHLNTSPHGWDYHLFSCPLSGADRMVPMLDNMTRDLDKWGTQLFQAMFERRYVEPELVAALNKLDGIWSQCSANRDILIQHGVDENKIRYIRYPYFDDDPHLQLQPPREHRRFLWIGRFEHRKAPDNLLAAFLRAFRPGDATLTLKLSTYTHKTPCRSWSQTLLEELGEPEVVAAGWTPSNWHTSIRIVTGRLSREEMVGLHAESDVYVSASRGEGLDLPSYAAKLAGRTVVTTDSGGPRDFISDGDVLVPATGVIAASDEYPWGEGATYSDYDMKELIDALVNVRSARPKGSRIDKSFRAEHVGREFYSWLEEVRG